MIPYTLEGNRVDGRFPDIASLEANAPAKLNANRDSQVGLTAPFAQVHSNGFAWVPTDFQAMTASLMALAATIPQPPVVTPPFESKTAVIGTPGNYATQDHVHPRLTSATWVTLDTSGVATVTFTQPFDAVPSIVLTPLNPTGKPVISEITSFVQNASSKYIGCVIRGYRLQTLPSTLTLLSALVSFDVSAGNVAGVQVSVTAIKSSA